MSHPDLNHLLARVSLADRQAFQQLYRHSSGKLYAIALRISNQEKLAEDILQESFIKIWHNAHRFDSQKAQAMTWMGTIVRNQAIDLLRKHKKQAESEPFDEDLHSTNSGNPTEDSLIRTDNHQAVHRCLKMLDEKYRQIILLAYLDGYTHQEIAEIKGLSISNVKNRIYRGIAMVKTCLQALYKGKV